MILNDNQLNKVINEKNLFSENLKKISCNEFHSNPFFEMEIQSTKSIIAELDEDINKYIEIKKYKGSFDSIQTIEGLKKSILYKRISSNVGQFELSRGVNISLENLVRIESENYKGVDVSTLIEMAEFLNLKINKVYDKSGRVVFDREKSIFSIPKDLLKEVKERLLFYPKLIVDDVSKSLINTTSFISFSLHKKTISSHKESKKVSLIAWESLVKLAAQKEILESNLSFFEANPSWLEELRDLTVLENGPFLAKDLLASKGITLIIMPHLDKTYLDGAALKSKEGLPIIGMSLRFDRLDNFWFVLFHELAHIYLHMYQDEDEIIEFVEEKVLSNENHEQYEIEANNFARKILIPEKSWKKSLSRIKPTENAVIMDARKMGIHPAILAGAIRNDKNDYSILSKLISSSKVRKLFGDIQW